MSVWSGSTRDRCIGSFIWSIIFQVCNHEFCPDDGRCNKYLCRNCKNNVSPCLNHVGGIDDLLAWCCNCWSHEIHRCLIVCQDWSDEEDVSDHQVSSCTAACNLYYTTHFIWHVLFLACIIFDRFHTYTMTQPLIENQSYWVWAVNRQKKVDAMKNSLEHQGKMIDDMSEIIGDLRRKVEANLGKI